MNLQAASVVTATMTSESMTPEKWVPRERVESVALTLRYEAFHDVSDATHPYDE